MCQTPLNLKDRIVKCGQCKECLTQKAKEWSLRLDQEARYSKTAYFLTLTYNEQNVPIVTDDGLTSLHKRDVQLFWKRLRKKCSVRYYCTGEYGGQFKRAHYHALVFGLDPSLTSFDPTKGNKKAQHDPKLAAIWQLGHVSTGRVEGGSIRYVTNYMMTKNIDVQEGQAKPFTLMSKGIGQRYIDKQSHNHNFHENYKMNIGRPPEKRPNLPRYYMEKIFSKPMQEKLNKEKEEEYSRLKSENYSQAEEAEPLDPHGWIRRMKELKYNKKKKP